MYNESSLSSQVRQRAESKRWMMVCTLFALTTEPQKRGREREIPRLPAIALLYMPALVHNQGALGARAIN